MKKKANIKRHYLHTRKYLKLHIRSPRLMLVVAIAVIGALTLVISRASGFSISLEPENNTNAGTTVLTDSTASGGKAIQFGVEGTTSPLQPYGNPLGRTMTSVLEDEFDGTSIDKSKWVALTGWGNNAVTSNPKNCTVSGGNLILALPGDSTGCDLYSSKAHGAGSNAYALQVGDYLEARIWFPGPGSAPTSTIYNWPAFWTYDGSGNWNAGEHDIAEPFTNMQYNYHCQPSGNADGHLEPAKPNNKWGNSWHVYGIYRDTSQVKVFYDGVLQGTIATCDNGGPEAIMFTSGESQFGAPVMHGSAGNVLVDWVRAWH